MKKLLAMILCAALLCAALLPVATAEADGDNLLWRIYAANWGDALRAAHESLVIRNVDKDGVETTSYMGTYYHVVDSRYLDGIRVRSSAYDYVLAADGAFGRFLTLDMENDPWQFYTEFFVQGEVLSVEEQGDSIVVTVKPAENYAPSVYPEREDADRIETKEVCVLDADTLESRSYQEVAVFPDGTEEAFHEATMEYDVECPYPEAIETIEAHLFGDEEAATRTTTFIIDEGTPACRSYSFETLVGDRCIIGALSERGIEYEFDMERSTPSNDAYDNDAVYYLVRVVADAEDAESAEGAEGAE